MGNKASYVVIKLFLEVLSCQDLHNTLRLKCPPSIALMSAEVGQEWMQRVLGLLCLWENNNGVLYEGIHLKPELLFMRGMHKDGCYSKKNLFCAL